MAGLPQSGFVEPIMLEEWAEKRGWRVGIAFDVKPKRKKLVTEGPTSQRARSKEGRLLRFMIPYGKSRIRQIRRYLRAVHN